MWRPAGAGKTAVADLVQHSLPAATRPSSHAFKAAHPDYLTLLPEDPHEAGAAVRTGYRARQKTAEDHVRAQRGHKVCEAADAPGDYAHASRRTMRRATGWRW
ncbi:zeta toxin family protein [Streptomyces reniochalinae]|uniref:zeta toxin family protein n=1 Tax=Streptomyces reniochalinae TaxID=2250578 RepID=UPI0015F0313D|nr:zeta toxin family protein [Streptomyces reniochalinae]